MPGPNRNADRMKAKGKPKNTGKTIGRLLKYMLRYWPALIIVLLAVVFSAGAQVLGDSMLRPAIDDYIIPLLNKVTSENVSLTVKDFLPFLTFLGKIAGIFLAGALCTWINLRLMLLISTRTLFRIRKDVFNHLETLPLRYFDNHTHGELMSLFTNDIDTLRDMMSQTVPQLLSSIITVAAVFVMMLIVSPLLTGIVIVCIFLMMAFAAFVGKKSAVAFRENQKNIAKVNGYIEEMMEGQKVVKVFNHEGVCTEEFNVINDELCKAGTRANSYANILMPIMNNMSHIQYACVAIAGAVLVISRGMTLGSIAAFLQYTRSFSRPITQMSQQINSVLNALAGAERIFAVIDEKAEIDDGTIHLVNATETAPSSSADGKVHLVQTFANTGEWAWKLPADLALSIDKADYVEESYSADENSKLIKLRGDVDFQNVSFSYVPEKEILHGISLHAKPGQKIALVGSTGSGKTTITNLLTRFYDIEEEKGSITFDGIPLKKICKSDLRKSLGMVLQDTHLFTGTIRDNIKYGNLEASEAQVIAAAKLANADHFIRHLEHGYDTVITGDGGNLSQGQRQLLAIARAAVADPPVLILDEATSSIDTRTEKLIEKGMDRLMEGRTVFVIAHRLSTVRNSDEIIVLEKGNIIERGNHNDLMKKEGRYYKLYTGAFELT